MNKPTGMFFLVSFLIFVSSLMFGCSEWEEFKKDLAMIEAESKPSYSQPTTNSYGDYIVPRKYMTKIGNENIIIRSDTDYGVEVVAFKVSGKNSCRKLPINKALLPEGCRCVKSVTIRDYDMDGGQDSCEKAEGLTCMNDYTPWTEEPAQKACDRRFYQILARGVKHYHSDKKVVDLDISESDGEWQYPVETMCKNIELKPGLSKWRNRKFKAFLKTEVASLKRKGLESDALGNNKRGIKGKLLSANKCRARAEFKMNIVDVNGTLQRMESCTGNYDFDPGDETWTRTGDLKCTFDAEATLKEMMKWWKYL